MHGVCASFRVHAFLGSRVFLRGCFRTQRHESQTRCAVIFCNLCHSSLMLVSYPATTCSGYRLKHKVSFWCNSGLHSRAGAEGFACSVFRGQQPPHLLTHRRAHLLNRKLLWLERLQGGPQIPWGTKSCPQARDPRKLVWKMNSSFDGRSCVILRMIGAQSESLGRCTTNRVPFGRRSAS